jgi:hypothetical protein
MIDFQRETDLEKEKDSQRTIEMIDLMNRDSGTDREMKEDLTTIERDSEIVL